MVSSHGISFFVEINEERLEFFFLVWFNYSFYIINKVLRNIYRYELLYNIIYIVEYIIAQNVYMVYNITQ